MAKRYYWLKLKEDFFSSPKIKKLRKIAGGDTYTIIYLKMQLLSVKNSGVIEFSGVENTFEEELALVLDEDVDNIAVTLRFLESQNLIESDGCNSYLLKEAAESIGSECESAERMRLFRAKKAELPSQCDANVRPCDVPLISNSISSSKSKSDSIIYKDILELFKKTCVSLPVPKKLTDKRRSAIKKAQKDVEEFGGWEKYFSEIESSDFLTNRCKNGWRADFDWILAEKNMVKIMEGNYRNKPCRNNYSYRNEPESMKEKYEALAREEETLKARGEYVESEIPF